jgi:hypothetical protein
LRQALAIELKLASNSQSSCLSFPHAGITSMHHHASYYIASLWIFLTSAAVNFSLGPAVIQSFTPISFSDVISSFKLEIRF